MAPSRMRLVRARGPPCNLLGATVMRLQPRCNCDAVATLSRSLTCATLRVGLPGRMPHGLTNGGLSITTGNLISSEQRIKAALATIDVRTLVANRRGISIARVMDRAHFTNDLGADWLDRLC